MFTQTLLPLLEKTSADGNDVRIVNVSHLMDIAMVHLRIQNIQVGSAGHQDVTYLSYNTKEAWNHKFHFTLMPQMSRYSMAALISHGLGLSTDIVST